MIKEVIVVEGRADESAVKKAVEAEIIVLSGFGISAETFQRIETAYNRRGIIILTDPDFAGERIRSRLSKRFPEAKHAFISREKATKAGDIGIENAAPENIRHALNHARCEQSWEEETFSFSDLQELGLVGTEDATQKRDKLGGILGIGYGNAKTFLKRLNHYGVTQEEVVQAIEALQQS